jgi:23S rRNA (guanine745-N1)-methyltransferase
LLRCPLCRLDLTGAPGALVCPNRHRFDLAREGYVNLLGGRYRRAIDGDDAAQVRHRTAFLDTGHFDPVATAIAAQLPDTTSILDAGCGTGHLLAGIAARLRGPVVGLGLDVAKPAARAAARRWPDLAFAVVDLWQAWPVRDRAADLVLSSFAPKNFAETARVLRPGGCLALVSPGPRHLAELVDRYGLIGQRAGKLRRYRDAITRAIGPPRVIRLVDAIRLDHGAVRDAILMGPNARHVPPARFDVDAEPVTVTVDLALLLARRLRPA